MQTRVLGRVIYSFLFPFATTKYSRLNYMRVSYFEVRRLEESRCYINRSTHPSQHENSGSQSILLKMLWMLNVREVNLGLRMSSASYIPCS